jgi:hypothetical protein
LGNVSVGVTTVGAEVGSGLVGAAGGAVGVGSIVAGNAVGTDGTKVGGSAVGVGVGAQAATAVRMSTIICLENLATFASR